MTHGGPNACYALGKRQPVHRFFPETSLNLVFEAEGGEQFELIDVLPDPTVDIEAETIAADLATRLHCFLATLSERDRVRWKDGMTIEMSAGFAKWQRQVAF